MNTQFNVRFILLCCTVCPLSSVMMVLAACLKIDCKVTKTAVYNALPRFINSIVPKIISSLFSTTGRWMRYTRFCFFNCFCFRKVFNKRPPRKSVFVCDIARLAKFWSQTVLYNGCGNGKSFFIELVAVKSALEEEGLGSSDHRGAFWRFLINMRTLLHLINLFIAVNL